MSMNPSKRRAAVPELFARFSRTTPHRLPARQGASLTPHTTPAEAADVAQAKEALIEHLTAAGAHPRVLAAVDHYVQDIARVTAQAAAKQALAEGARLRLMAALRFAVGVNLEGSSLLRSERARDLKEIADLQRQIAEKDAALRLLADGRPGRYFKSLGHTICRDTRDILNHLDDYESVLASGQPAQARPLINSLRSMCENLEEYGENAVAYAN